MKHFIRALSLFALFFCGILSSNATHIVGGSLTYEHLGGSSYRILLKLYRDCSPSTVPTPIALQTTAAVDIYDANGNPMPFSPVVLNRIQLTTVPLNLDTCVADPGICVQEGLFAGIVNNLPPTPGGYHMYFETCCRNGSIDNLNNPTNLGEGFYCRISDNTMLLSNSSPQWKKFPPVFICQGQPINFDHGATDPEGDSLVYSFYRPLSDIDYLVSNDLPFTAGNPNFAFVNYNGGFGVNNPLGGANLTISTAGVIDGIPANTGQYVVGVRCDEYRDGILIGSIYRDFQFNVVVCPPPALAGIGPVDGCAGTAIQFTNASTSTANGFTWNFGDGSPTSTQTNPSHTYPGLGTYTVSLIAQTGTPCADTAYQTFSISFSNANFNANDSICVGAPITFTDASSAAGSSTITSWNWNFGDGTSSGLPNPTHTYSTGGTYSIQLIVNSSAGCRDTLIQPLFVQGLPAANAGIDTTACNNNPLIGLNGIITNAGGGLWLNGSGTYSSGNNSLITDYIPTAAEVAAGSIDLVLSTTGNGLCPTASDTIHIDFIDGPVVDAGPDLQVCKDTTSVPLNGSVQFAGGGQWSTSGTGTFSPADDVLNASYIPTSADTAAGAVMIYLTATNVGNCITSVDSMEISFYNPPTLSIMNDDTTCSGEVIPMLVNVSTGQGVWTSLGSGTFSPDSSANAVYIPSAADIAAGNVVLAFVSTNNGGCQAVRDTIDIDIIPSPIPAFTFTEPCFGGTNTFTDGSTAIGNVVAWEWDFGDGTTDNNQNSSHVFGTPGTQNVTLIVTSSNGCRDTLTQAVDVHYIPEPGFFSPNPCLNGGTDFTDTSSVTNSTITSWSWDFGDGGTDTTQNPNHLYAGSGTFPVTLTVTSAFGCTNSITQNTTVLPGPNADFTSSSSSVNQFEVVNFTDQSQPNVVAWQWDFGDSTAFDFNQNPSHAWDAAGTFPVTLVVTDNNGCIDTAVRYVVIFLPPKVPSAFTPNGDGQNDVLYVMGGPFKEILFRIYNNWGEIIYESSEPSTCLNSNDHLRTCFGWDGTYNDVPQPMGVYVYTVFAITEDDVEHELTGDVTLLR